MDSVSLILHQRNVDLATYHGKVVVLDFWATWCAPCLTEMPRFVEWQQEYGERGLQVIGISMDDEVPAVSAAFEKYRLNFPVRFKHQGVTDLNIIDSEIQTLLPGH
jgi:cytochrome c biogenesis protein CcmG/thiol:disulfide interchange protein DsbE